MGGLNTYEDGIDPPKMVPNPSTNPAGRSLTSSIWPTSHRYAEPATTNDELRVWKPVKGAAKGKGITLT